MLVMDGENYDEIADEDLIQALDDSSPAIKSFPLKRRRCGTHSNEGTPSRRRHICTTSGDEDFSDIGTEDLNMMGQAQSSINLNDRVEPVVPSQSQGTETPSGISSYEKGESDSRTPGAEKTPTVSKPFQTVNQQPISDSSFQQSRVALDTHCIDAELEGLPSDAFSSPEPIPISDSIILSESSSRVLGITGPRQQLLASQQGLRQTTLFGGSAAQAERASPKSRKTHNYIADQAAEAPTHHALNKDALSVWVYPMNLGDIRDYQYTIVKNGLFHNLLVALPTGLGKTFIAATIMLNYFRWTESAQIIFVAPTKPLVAQQVDACFNVVGIPKSQTTMLTGEQAPALRAEEWATKRVFFMTPQTLENDLVSGIADPKKITLLVVDEAHRATGNYSYVRVVSFLRRFNKSYRVLALTATPGSTIEAVQEVIDNLEISKVEIRTEESLDIQQFVHRRNIDQIILDPSEEIIMIKTLFSKALQPLVNILCTGNAYWNRDPMALTPFGMMKARTAWMQSDAGRRANPGLKGMMNSLFTILASIAHSIKLLNFHGISPFYFAIKDFRDSAEESNKPGKYKNQIISSSEFKNMMSKIQSWLSKDDFIGHPKMTFLCDTILNHFLDAGEGRSGENTTPSTTRVIVFAEYRDSAEDIARVLNRHAPLIRASVFVGQADSKRSEGMNQKKQLKAIQDFTSGTFNVIVATSIGEEGLDIGQVDLIVCYDSSASPIRMLQRMGRTGRKRAGKIVLLLMKGKEEDSFTKAKDNYEHMQKIISSGTRFNFRHDLSVRIIPREIIPVVEKRVIELPIENTQNPGLPEPKRRTAPKKKPAKKFNMPDGVETNFTMASNLNEGKTARSAQDQPKIRSKKLVKDLLAPLLPAETVFLRADENTELEQKYQKIDGDDMQEVTMPEMTTQTVSQRSLRPFGNVAHGVYTKRCVQLFKTLAILQRPGERNFESYNCYDASLEYLDLPTLIDETRLGLNTHTPKSAKPRGPTPKKSRSTSNLDMVRRTPVTSGRDYLLASAKEMGVDERPEISGDSTEGEGDDLRIASELSDDGTDEGEDLRDFINDKSSQVGISSSLGHS
ncbi:BgTH12-06045 [Blumeria graminis f. sp. triticale]|nr:BgTH12-06045 [Blumeria graminis f. sp. triticale]